VHKFEGAKCLNLIEGTLFNKFKNKSKHGEENAEHIVV
jgi:hypothetical protein